MTFTPFSLLTTRYALSLKGELTRQLRCRRPPLILALILSGLIIADAQATVIGGRNVGDEYFGATTGVLKADLDALLVGPVVNDIATDFDRYWASQSSYPVERIVAKLETAEQSRTLDAILDAESSAEAQRYLDAIRESTFVTALLNSDLKLQWSPVQMVTDDPAKGLGEIEGEGLLINQLDTILAQPARSVVLVSPYFVPTKVGTDTFIAIEWLL